MTEKLLKERIRGQVHFGYYRDGELWYKTDDGFVFPVPISDTGTGLFQGHDKGILFMRWIRRHMELVESSRTEQVGVST